MARYLFGTSGTYRADFLPVGPEADALGIFLVEVERLCPAAPRRLRDEVLPVYSSMPDPESEEWSNAAPRRLVKVRRKWERDFHLDRWTSTGAAKRFTGAIEFILVAWCIAAEEEESSLIPDSENTFLGVSGRSRDNATWTDLLQDFSLDKKHWTRYLLVSNPEYQRISGAPRPRHQPPYNPINESRAEYLKRARAVPAGYCSAVERSFEQAGAVKATGKQKLDHFTWLVRYQVLGESFKDLTDALHVQQGDPHREADMHSVYRAVRRTARLFGLKLRVDPGRPQKQGPAPPRAGRPKRNR